MAMLIFGMVLFIIGAFVMGFVLQGDQEFIPTLLFCALITIGACVITDYCITECHQDIIDKAGYELDLRDSKEVEK